MSASSASNGLMLDQQPSGVFNVIDEDGKIISKGPMSRADAYAFIERKEHRDAK